MMKPHENSSADNAVSGMNDAQECESSSRPTPMQSPENSDLSKITPEFQEPTGIVSELILSIATSDPDQPEELVRFAHAGGRMIVEIVDNDDKPRLALTLTQAQVRALTNWLKFVTASR